MFKNKLLKKLVLAVGISLIAIGSISVSNSKAATVSDTSDTNQMLPMDYVNNYLDGIQTNLTIQSYDLPSETDGYWRTYDQFLSKDMTTWLGSSNLAYAYSARNNYLTKYFEYRLSPADDNFAAFASTVVPDLKANGGTANLKLQVLNIYNSGQVLKELPITVNVPAPMSELDVDYNDSTTYLSSVTPSIFQNTFALPTFSITDKDTGATYKATKISPVSNVYIDGKKTEINTLPHTLKAGTYTQSIFFTVDGMSQAQLSQLASSSKIIGNNGNAKIRYSNGQLIASRTTIVQ
ncbi:hypothetical protein [Companilactobacillus ginsenosidimutans]|uniref:DUF4397 domain-containing protein n=1 Tax=Companilactobacillus ginsenosidimutans TaxID=1007676 RepID=A0A0H4QHQ2_9LACO|nr:hypothetical protein [Companilactobacillus ginsenosidimutans]AKP66551.1 hypothetical protein ABM34_02610 [Companilactobacillus ginsenosidimutans]